MDRKSAKIAPRDFSTPIVAMANADGGYLAVGIEDDGTITGIDAFEKNLNELLRVPFDFCIPSVEVENTILDVYDCHGNPNHILRMHVLPSTRVIANQADEVYLRVGDKSKKLNFEQRLQLVYAKGVKYYEDEPVAGATLRDIDLEYVGKYIEKIGYAKGDAEYYLRHNYDFVTAVDGEDKISTAAILLFGNNPQRFFPRARLRFVKYDGRKAEVGDRMNVIKDQKFKGRILDQVQNMLAFVKTQIREYTKLGEGAVFQTIPEYPEFCWTELIVNAVAHRDYSIKGTDIQIKMYDDHFDVESPGLLPGIVKVNNIREFHFSRNPKIVELLTEYDLVKEYGEGVDRIFRDMEEAGLPEPVYRQSDFMLYATLKNKNYGTDASWASISTTASSTTSGGEGGGVSGGDDKQLIVIEFCAEAHSKPEIQEYLGIKSERYVREKLINPLLKDGRLRRTEKKINSKNQKYIATKTEMERAQAIMDNNPVLEYSPGDLRREGRTVEEYLEKFGEAEKKKYLEYYEDEV
ncbi:MAG: putative DNA binding domain-containing protein [Oscillospiraceae bacterium]|nr:putative DNA binding domain-containing protein [Oscillospiraceae bacterium]